MPRGPIDGSRLASLDNITDPAVWGTITQTIVLTLTLVIFILSFRSQEKTSKENAYQKVLDDTTDAMRMLVTNPDLAMIQVEMARTIAPTSRTASLSKEEMGIRNYLLLLYGIFERAYMLYSKKWIDREAWSQWSTWLETMMKHPLFVEVHSSSIGMFDRPFQDYVSSLLDSKGSK